MRGKFVTLALLAATLAAPATAMGAADPAAPYLGEWAIMIQNAPGGFPACWLKVVRKDSGLDARLLWRYGSVTEVKSIQLVNGELEWVRPEYWEAKKTNVDTTYRAKIAGGQLAGSVKFPDGVVYQFTGVPSIDKVDVSGKWVVVAAEDPDAIKRTIELKQEGDKITGTYSDGQVTAPVTGTRLEGNSIAIEIRNEEFQAKCKATAEGDRIRGTYEYQGDTGTFSGERQRQRVEKIVLFDGKDFQGWRSRDPKQAQLRWEIKEEKDQETGKPYRFACPLKGGADIFSEQKFDDFELHVEYRLPEKNGNSGVYVRGRYEVQMLDDYGKGVTPHGCGAIYSRVSPTKNVTRPFNTWQEMDIALVGSYITVKHNGEVIVDNAYLEGITGGALDAAENEPGPVMLQAHGEAINFRNVWIVPLRK